MLNNIRRHVWLVPLLLIALITIVVALKLLKPGVPTRVVLATGAPGGAYEAFGARYAEIFKRDGVTLVLKPTKGSVENLGLLLEPKNDVEAAFLQSGIATEAQRDELVSLGSLFYEPVWVFYREPKNKIPLTRLTELRDKRIGIGATGGGTRPVSIALLAANEITAANASFQYFRNYSPLKLLLQNLKAIAQLLFQEALIAFTHRTHRNVIPQFSAKEPSLSSVSVMGCI